MSDLSNVILVLILQMALLNLLSPCRLFLSSKEEYRRKIQDGVAEKMLFASWQSHVGTACQGVK